MHFLPRSNHQHKATGKQSLTLTLMTPSKVILKDTGVKVNSSSSFFYLRKQEKVGWGEVRQKEGLRDDPDPHNLDLYQDNK